MLETSDRNKCMVVDLRKDILVRTTIPKANHAALRSGFAGYPANPRWNTAKFIAWKTGCQWRNALQQGEMVVRSQDSMLVPATNPENKLEQISANSKQFKFPIRTKWKFASSQTA